MRSASSLQHFIFILRNLCSDFSSYISFPRYPGQKKAREPTPLKRQTHAGLWLRKCHAVLTPPHRPRAEPIQVVPSLFQPRGTNSALGSFSSDSVPAPEGDEPATGAASIGWAGKPGGVHTHRASVDQPVRLLLAIQSIPVCFIPFLSSPEKPKAVFFCWSSFSSGY